MMNVEEFEKSIYLRLNSTLKPIDIKDIKAKSTVELHSTLGRFLRNNWNLWENDESKKSDIVKFFNSYKIYHADDMSAIVLDSYKAILEDRDIEFEKQVKYYLDYWKKMGFIDGVCKQG